VLIRTKPRSIRSAHSASADVVSEPSQGGGVDKPAGHSQAPLTRWRRERSIRVALVARHTSAKCGSRVSGSSVRR
jgi:hypothetical protein